MKKLCVNCRNLFETAPNIPNQSYCTLAKCQRARKAAWTGRKLASDIDYKTNQRRAQKSWQKANPDYWKKYRERVLNGNTTPQSSETQRSEDADSDDTQLLESLPFNGLFELRVISQIRRVKIDVYIVEIKQYRGFKESRKTVKR